tara:strand:- start:53 stop:1069 length:1017 start_codon:yes stop_codon:yes gene_type:complete
MDLVKTISDFRSINQPLLLFGPPGVGKSQMVAQAAGKDPVIDCRLSMLDPVDLRGMPMINRGKECDATVNWARPDFIPADGQGILLLDELNTAPPAVQNAALQLVLDRRCGPHKLGDGWYIVAACNKASHKAHVNQISAPLRNRFVILDVEPDLSRWTKWAFERKIDQTVLGFLNWKPDALYNMPKDEHAPFPTPRSWALVSYLLKTVCKDGENKDYIAGTVGAAAAGEYYAYVDEIQHMPDVDKLLDGTETYLHDPRKPSITYAIVVNLVYKTVRKIEKVDRAAQVVSGFGEEFESLFFSNLLQGAKDDDKPELIINRNVRTWTQKHGYRADTALVY